MKLTSLTIAILASLSTLTVEHKAVIAQALVSGASVHFIPDPISGNNFIQTISGSVSIPTGSFVGSTSIQSLANSTGSNINGISTFDLLINPTSINLNNPSPVTLNQQAAELLSNATNISEIVSIIRANSNFLRNPSTNQAVATGATTLSSSDGLIQTASAEVSLPIGLFFFGFNDGQNTGGCNGISGCLKISPFIDNFIFNNTSTPPVIQELTVDPGRVGLVNAPFDLATTAATVLSGQTNLSNIVSIIRAVSDANGVASPQVQARAMGAVTVENPDGTTISVSGEIALPAGLYFALEDQNSPGKPLDCSSTGPALGCMSVIPEFALLNVGTQDFLNVLHLTVNPGEVQPGNPSLALNPNALDPASTDLNASAAARIYQNAADITLLSNLVSIIRAGAGVNGLSPTTRPTARASGSATIVLPNGATQSLNGETNLSNSLYFQGGNAPSGGIADNLGYCSSSACLVIVPTITIDTMDINQSTIEELAIDAGLPSTDAGWNFDAAAGYALSVAGTLSEQVSIIRAGGGLE